MSLRRLLAGAFAVSLLAACATGPAPQAPVDAGVDPAVELARVHQDSLAGIESWALKGRIGLIRGEEGWHAGIDWRQQDDAYEVELNGPIGQAAMRLIGGADGIVLFVPEQAPRSADSPEALIRDTMGFELPVSGLRWWMTGRMQPGASALTTLDEQGRIREIRQDRWTVRFQDYRQVDGVDLPRKLRLEHPEVTIKLVLREWRLRP